MRGAMFGMAMMAGAVPASAAPRLLVFPVQLADTSGEVADQRADHDRRLAALATGMAAALTTGGTTATAPAKALLAARCPTDTADCLLDYARAERADFIVLAVVHKVSSLIVDMSVRLVDPVANRTTMTRTLSFRGDDDAAWARAGRFVTGQIRDGLAGE